MMLRSLVKKFKSHSLNEDAPECQQQQTDNGAVVSTSSSNLSTSTALDQAAPDSPRSNNWSVADHTTRNSTPFSVAPKQEEMKSVKCETAPSLLRSGDAASIGGRNQLLRQDQLRNSARCGCNGNSVSSIATRLRSSVMSASSNSSITGQQHQQSCYYHHHHNAFCPHRQKSNDGRSFRQRSMAKPGGDVGAMLDDEYCKDSGTESDDEELERIETNSTHSVPVSQTSDYYASQQSLSINSCRSSHCSSPLLGLSDQECNSWESVGSESGISVRTTPKAPSSKHHQYQSKPYEQHQKYQHFRLSSHAAAVNHVHPTKKFDVGATSATSMRPPSDMIFTEELPQHHYHTRQQFHRMTQQISMQNGQIRLIDASDRVRDDGEPSQATEVVALSSAVTNANQSTAFVPVRRSQATAPLATIDQSPEGAGGSSLDELEEANFGSHEQKLQHEQKASRRVRSTAAFSTPIVNLGTSEKRKWSQIRQEQKRLAGHELGSSFDNVSGYWMGDKKRQDRPILQAARKTPIKLLFSLDSGPSLNDCVEQKSSARYSSRCQVHNQQLPHRGNASPPVGTTTKKLRSTKKKCKSDCFDEDGKGDGMDTRHHRCPKDSQQDDEEEDDESGHVAKRPSLDFNKMRGKLVSVGALCGIKRKSKRSTANCVGRKNVLKAIDGRREGYQLRSTHRQCCLFRPLEPPTATTSHPNVSDGQPSSSWFNFQPQQEQEAWQQGTFFFGSNSSGQ